MGLYNFQQRFVPKILAGEKQHTIRAGRKYPDCPGATMYLYTGLRTRHAKLLMRAPCIRVEPIEIRSGNLVIINGVGLAKDEREAFACRDGFASFREMMEFWDGRLPFHGHIYHWSFKGATHVGL